VVSFNRKIASQKLLVVGANNPSHINVCVQYSTVHEHEQYMNWHYVSPSGIDDYCRVELCAEFMTMTLFTALFVNWDIAVTSFHHKMPEKAATIFCSLAFIKYNIRNIKHCSTPDHEAETLPRWGYLYEPLSCRSKHNFKEIDARRTCYLRYIFDLSSGCPGPTTIPGSENGEANVGSHRPHSLLRGLSQVSPRRKTEDPKTSAG
jgi:hypothetical protein